jgi:hypothetical protein
MSNPDTSSAEWIAEAPSAETQGGLQVLPLANFREVTFTNASATAAGHTGSISDAAWDVQEIQLGAPGSSPFAGTGAYVPATVGSDGLATLDSGGAAPIYRATSRRLCGHGLTQPAISPRHSRKITRHSAPD